MFSQRIVTWTDASIEVLMYLWWEIRAVFPYRVEASSGENGNGLAAPICTQAYSSNRF